MPSFTESFGLKLNIVRKKSTHCNCSCTNLPQKNIYDENKEFVSAKKVAIETPGCENLQLISFHSTSKGLIGECGRRGGMMELHNIDPYVQTQLYKLASSGLCSGVAGQMMMSLMVRPPLPGGESYELFNKEETAIFESLKRRAVSVSDVCSHVCEMLMQVPQKANTCYTPTACEGIKRHRWHGLQSIRGSHVRLPSRRVAPGSAR